MSRAARLSLRAVFAALLLSLPLMIVVRERVGEAYPGLYQPAFDAIHMNGDLLRRTDVDIVVRDTSGADHDVAIDRLVDVPSVDEETVQGMVRSLLRDRATVQSPAVAAQLRRRFVHLGITSPDQMTVTWYATTRDPHRPGAVDRGRRITRYVVRLAP